MQPTIKCRTKWYYFTETELRIAAAALEYYVKLGPRSSGPIQVAERMEREVHQFLKELVD